MFGAPRPAAVWSKTAAPDFGAIRGQLQTHRNLTLQLVWEEYREDHPDGYRYSRFCELYRNWARHLDVVMRQEYRAGEKLFIDYAGDKIPVYNPGTGDVDFEAPLFVAVLGASSYTFAEATRSQDLTYWISSHIHALELFGGAPEVAVQLHQRDLGIGVDKGLSVNAPDALDRAHVIGILGAEIAGVRRIDLLMRFFVLLGLLHGANLLLGQHHALVLRQPRF